MGWEKRKGGSGRYYTRSRRVNGRVVREYIGCGPVAEAIAALDVEERWLREAQHRRHREQIAAAEATDKVIKDFGRLCDLLVEVELLKAGYHKHKGEWRKRHVPETDNDS